METTHTHTLMCFPLAIDFNYKLRTFLHSLILERWLNCALFFQEVVGELCETGGKLLLHCIICLAQWVQYVSVSPLISVSVLQQTYSLQCTGNTPADLPTKGGTTVCWGEGKLGTGGRTAPIAVSALIWQIEKRPNISFHSETPAGFSTLLWGTLCRNTNVTQKLYHYRIDLFNHLYYYTLWWLHDINSASIVGKR